MTLEELKKNLQSHFTDGLVTIVGSGLSVACGLPSMDDLAAFLLEHMPKRLDEAITEAWNTIAENLKRGMSLEPALKNIDTDSPLLYHITDLVGECVGSKEKKFFEDVLNEQQLMPFADLLSYLIFSDGKAVVITSNYDRLIEFAAELSGYGVDTGFVGYYYGKFDPKLSHEALGFAVASTVSRKQIKRTYRQRVVIYKPHGSLDWYSHNGVATRSTMDLDAPHLMITPGSSKYRKGYEIPFDHHRNLANDAIDKAARYFIIGYGFNDDQLETHLRSELARGKPCVLLSKSITENTAEILKRCPNIIALSSGSDESKPKTIVHYSGKTFDFPNVSFWNLNEFIKEVLK